MRSFILLPALVSALALTAGAAQATPVKPANKAITTAPVTEVKPKPAAAASSSSSSSSASKSGSQTSAGDKSKLPDYQAALTALLDAQKLAKIDPAKTTSGDAGGGIKMGDGADKTSANASAGSINMADDEKAETAITQAIAAVKEAAAADRVTVSDTAAGGAEHNGGVGIGHAQTPEGDLSSAASDLARAHDALIVKVGMATSGGAQHDLADVNTDIAEAEKDVKSAENLRPNYAEVASKLALAEAELGKIADDDVVAPGNSDKSKADAAETIAKGKKAALVSIKSAETDVTSIAKTEHLTLASSHGSSDGRVSTNMRGDDALAGKAVVTFTEIHSTLDTALEQLRRGDASPEVQSDLKQATGDVTAAADEVKAAEDAQKALAPGKTTK